MFDTICLVQHFVSMLAFRNTRSMKTPTPFLRQLLLVIQFIGTTLMRSLHFLLGEHKVVSSVHVVKFCLAASMVVVLMQEEISLSIELGGETASEVSQPTAIAEASFFSGLFSSHTRTLEDEAALRCIDRFGHVAEAEQERFGIDAGVLLAAAIVAAGPQHAQGQLSAKEHNAFGAALDGRFASAWESWRAMSLTLVAAAPQAKPSTRAGWITLVAAQYPDAESRQEQLRYVLERYAL